MDLAENAHACLPDIIGFNVACEQLPLRLMISVYELDLTLIPTTLLADNRPRLDSVKAFWQRVKLVMS